MKTWLVLSVVLLSITDSYAGGKKIGWREAYGGNGAIVEFKQIANDIALLLIKRNFKNDFDLNNLTLPSTIDNSSIECGTELVLDDEPKDAINFPNVSPQKIILDCNKWENQLTYAQKMNLAIHEYLPLAGIDDSSYEYSMKIINFFKKWNEKKEELNHQLHTAIWMCNYKLYDKLIGLGANPYEMDEYGSVKSLDTAIKGSCDSIIESLADKGVEYLQSEDTPSHITLIEKSFYVYESSQKEAALKTLKLLITRWPELLNFEFHDTQLSTLSNLRRECYEGSSILHLLASTRSFKKEEFDFNFFNGLALLGFSLDKKNVCGDTPAELLKKQPISL